MGEWFSHSLFSIDHYDMQIKLFDDEAEHRNKQIHAFKCEVNISSFSTNNI